MFVHMVFFWLKDGTPEMERAKLVDDCTGLLGKIPVVRHVYAGRPAMTPRDVVDNSYDVGLCVILDDTAAHDVYQVHELHKEFIVRHKEHWARVQIYDFR